MRITLYLRTYPVKDAPVTLSLFPFPARQRHTFTFEGRVYEAVGRELHVVVPDDAVLDADRQVLIWNSDQGRARSTAAEVFDLAQANLSGFQTVS